MKLPLFVQSASIPSDSSYVLVGKGEWVVDTDIVDAILNLSINGTLYLDIKNGQKLSVSTPAHARASIVKGGSEKHITLYLSRWQST